MNELRSNYENMDKPELVSIIRSQQSELAKQESVIKAYKKHLEEVIEYQSVEKYRESVKTNKGAAGTTLESIALKKAMGTKLKILIEGKYFYE